MATKRRPRSRSGLIHCDNCGEDYSDTYKRCPFCDEYAGEYEPLPRAPRNRGGGKRVANSARGGRSVLHIVSIVVSLAIIIAGIWIVVTKIMPMVDRGDVEPIDPNTSLSGNPDTSPVASPVPSPVASPDSSPATGDEPVVSPTPSPSPTVPADTATGFSLSTEDVTLERRGQTWKPGVTFTPAGSTAALVWESDDESVATVSADGTVTAVGLGRTTISAMLPSGVTHACIIRCRWTEDTTSSVAPSSDAGASGSYTVNNPDFTFYRSGETFRLRVSDYSGSVSWSSSNTGVATVAGDGTCTAVANGTCTVTGTLENGATVEAIVRVNISG